MKRKIRSSFTSFYVFLILFSFMSADSQAQPERTVTVQGEADPYEVTLYLGENYANPIGTWKLAPGMRMLRIPQLDKIPQSIFLGSKVGALLFPDQDFRSTLQGATSVKINFGSSNEPKDKYLIPYFRFKNSTPKMFTKYAPSYRCSLVIHRKDIDDFLGVYLQTGNYAGWFFPLPDKARESSVIYYKIPEGGPWTLSVLPGGLGTMSLYPSVTPPNPNDLAITITAPNGMTLKIPEPKCTTTQFDLSKQGVQQVSSLMIQYKGPFDEQAYFPPKAVRAPPAPDPPKPAESLATGKQGPGAIQAGQARQGLMPGQVTTPDLEKGFDRPGTDYKNFPFDGGPEGCQQTCAEDPNCKAFTWVRPGVQGPQARCWLKSGVPSAVANADCVSGVKTTPATAQPSSSAPASPQSPAASIGGAWKSSIGLAYEIRQRGEQFGWSVANSDEKGRGTCQGKAISATWSGSAGSGSAKGNIVGMDNSGKATRIEWDNGAVFFR